jgi:hypothetical protein
VLLPLLLLVLLVVLLLVVLAVLLLLFIGLVGNDIVHLVMKKTIFGQCVTVLFASIEYDDYFRVIEV